MKFSAKQIAEFLKGEVEGDQNTTVSSFSKIEEGKPGTLSFLSNPKYENYLYSTDASIVLVKKNFVLQQSTKATMVRVDDPYQALAALLTLTQGTKPQKKGIEPQTHISKTATIGKDVYVAAFTSIGDGAIIEDGVKIYSNCNIGDNVRIGKETLIYGGATVYEGCVVGRWCVLHAGCVVGSDGFGFAPMPEDYAKIPQIGNVIIEDHVEIGANCAIDRATMGSTIIRKGVKLDNLIQIAHNVEIDENTVIAAQTGIAGSTKIGKNCMVGGQVGFAGHITVADDSKFGAQSGVANTIKEKGKIYLGSPAIEIIPFRKSHAVFKALPDLRKTLYQLQREIKELKDKLEKSE